jgi:hypothetical protein
MYWSVRFLWDLSAPRYVVEALFIEETAPLPWKELIDGNEVYDFLGYNRNHFALCLVNVVVIGILWMVLAMAGLKLRHRDMQK